MLSSVLEEITDEYLLEVVLFFVKYRLKVDLPTFLAQFFMKDQKIKQSTQLLNSLLWSTEYINEENLSTRGIVEEENEVYLRKSTVIKKMIYKSPFVKPFSQYTSQLQMDLRFKYFICKELGLDNGDLIKEENSKAKTIYKIENSASILDSSLS